ncbi:myb sant-like dna-binding domain-containing protein 3 protein [Lasius niger]|uniref:Regulatory protein zeste n=1 Tax=Lasius niger TaxID=67767 RepID=A0A0J7KCQ6_LASNI|nr:myb sant-like dna-binding domain-containing protein 3 protein [Lasius niger]
MMGEETLPVHDRRYCPLDYVDREEDYTVKEGVEDSNIQPTLRIWVELYMGSTRVLLKTKYSHIIEKKSDATTLKDKEEAWNQICDAYNISSIVTSKRSVQQLKKLWSNLKSVQRDALTQEKQARLSTGNGPEPKSAEIDPDIAAIASNLMTTAPTLFSSNLSDEILKDSSSDETDDAEKENNPVNVIFKNNDKVLTPKGSIKNRQLGSEFTPKSLIKNRQLESELTPKSSIKKRQLESENVQTVDEKSFKIKRIKCIIDQEQQLANLKMQHQETIQTLEIDHLKKKYALEIRAAMAATELSEFLLKEKINN